MINWDSVNPVFQYKKHKAKQEMLNDYDTLIDMSKLQNTVVNNRPLHSTKDFQARFDSSVENYNKSLTNYNNYLKNNTVLSVTKNKDGSHKIVEIDKDSAKDIKATIDHFQKMHLKKTAGFLNEINPFWRYNRSKAKDAMLDAYDAYDHFTSLGGMTTVNSLGHDTKKLMGQLKTKEDELRSDFEAKKNEYNKYLDGNKVFAIVSNKNGQKKIIERPEEEFNDNKAYIKNVIKSKYMQELMNNDLLGED